MDTPLAIELLHHAMAVRALARLLVSDQHADDLVQDVALQALRSPPPSPVGLRAFFQTVARRVASNHRRGERRRQRREADAAAVARDERWHAPSPADVVAQQEQVQRVVAALLALPEPYRDVLFRRFFHDATPTAIAGECGVPVATVKSQLQRGLAMLRERLDASERPDWREALVAGVGLERIAVVGSGGIGVGLVLQLVFAAALVVLGWFAWQQHQLSWQPQAAAPGGGFVAAASGSGSRATQPDGVDPADRALAAGTAAPGAVAASYGSSRLRGRCVDDSGRPLAAVHVELTTKVDDEKLFHWLRDHEPPERPDRKVTTASDGVFEFRVAPEAPLHFKLTLRAPERMTLESGRLELTAGTDRDFGDVVLARGLAVTGRIVDRAGVPQAGCSVTFFTTRESSELTPTDICTATTAADGTFVMAERLPAGRYQVQVSERRVSAPFVALAAHPPAQHFEIVADRVVVPMAMAGIVVDELGNPVADARVGLVTARLARTGADGRFRWVRPQRLPDVVQVSVDHHGYEPVDAQEVAWGREDLRFVLRRGVHVEVRVTTAGSGVPVEDVYVDLDPHVGSLTGREGRLYGPFTNGVVRAGPFRRGRYRLTIVPRAASLAPVSRDIVVGEVDPLRVDVALPARAETRDVAVHVRFADGRPVAASVVEVREMWTIAAGEAEARSFVAATTDARGVATLRAPVAAPVRVQVRGPAHMPFTAAEVQLSAAEPYIATVVTGTRVTGRVAPHDLVARYRALATGSAKVQVPHLVCAPADALTAAASEVLVPIGPDGAFDLGRLADGDWAIQLTWVGPGNDEVFPRGREPLRTVQVGGEVLELTIDAARFAACHVASPVSWNGAPLVDTELDLTYLGVDADGNATEDYCTVRTDARGWLVAALRPGRVRVECIDTAEGFMIVGDETLDLPPGGAVDEPITLRAGTVRLRLLRPDGTPARGVCPYFWDASAERQLCNSTLTDERGEMSMVLMTGTYAIQLGDHGEHGTTLGTVTVATGTTTELTFTVAADAR